MASSQAEIELLLKGVGLFCGYDCETGKGYINT